MKGLSEKRLQELEDIARLRPGTTFNVIISLEQSASPEAVLNCGFEVEHTVLSAKIVTGKATIDCLRQLMALPEVALIEEDGVVRAISD